MINKIWICKECKTEYLSYDKPIPIRWSDGHQCIFDEE